MKHLFSPQWKGEIVCPYIFMLIDLGYRFRVLCIGFYYFCHLCYHLKWSYVWQQNLLGMPNVPKIVHTTCAYLSLLLMVATCLKFSEITFEEILWHPNVIL